MRRLSDLPEAEAAAALRACCASERWVVRMLSQRPFRDRADVFDSALRIWADLEPADWLEAFAAHPRLGDTHAETDAGAAARAASQREQAGLAKASDEAKAALAVANAEYESRFGWIYLVCAAGRGADDLLAACRARLVNEPAAELKVAADEQAKITALRLEELLTL